MADVQNLKDKGIPLKIDGSTRFVKGATKYTTCGDVIKMVLKKTGVKKEYRHLFTIYEVTRDEEKALPCKSRIMKVMESWKGEPNKFVLRKSDPLTPPTLNEKKKRWNLGKRSKEEMPEIRKHQDPYAQTLQSLVEMVDRRKGQRLTASGSENMQAEDFADSTSDSDSSIDEFLSKLDHSKMAGLLNFFVAMAKKKQKRESRCSRSSSSSTQDSDDSSDVSPVKPRRRKIKKTRHLLKKPKYGNSRSRIRESADIHPKKIHAVQMINFGFIDAEPRVQDRVYSVSDVRSVEEHEIRSRSNSNRIFSVRRRLIPSRKTSYNIQEETYSRRCLPKTSSRAETCQLHRLSENCKEVWCESPIHSVDSEYEENLNSSSDLDNAFVLRNNTFDVMTGHHHVETPEQGRIFRNCANNKRITSSVRKLVEYSMTDDELENSDAFFDTEDDADLKEVKDDNVSHSVCEEKISYSEENDPEKEFKNEICASHFKNDANGNLGQKHDVTNYIKTIFGKKFENEDEEMNSFMKSIVLNDSLDEGLSSMGSDLEQER